MRTTIKILILIGLTISMAFSCTKEEKLPANQAEGTILQTFRACYGYWIMIEVENPKGIGVSGTFAFPGDEDSRITYQNAIGIPYFDKIPELHTEAPDTIGTWLRFEYRDLTTEERNSNIFVDTSFQGICNTMIAPPDAHMYMITKIIGYR